VNLAELRQFFREQFSQSSVEIDEVESGRVRVRQKVGEAQLRPGGPGSGPVMMAAADAAAYAVILAAIGPVALAVTTDLSIHFLRKPEAGRDIVADGVLLKLGKRLAVVDARVYSDGVAEPVAQATVTYSIPPPQKR
jgi:uncharacterized protein (TIGR00369 family)